MRATILLLPGHDAGARLCAVAEEILTDIATAFGHTLVLLREKIGEYSVRAYDTPLTEETVEACMDADAVLLGDTSCAGADELLESMGIPSRTRAISLGGSACLYIARALSLDAASINGALRFAFQAAAREETPLYYVAPGGAKRADWLASVDILRPSFGKVTAEELSPEKAVDRLIHAPETLGTLCVPPYAGLMLCEMATALHGAPMLLFDACGNGKHAVYAPVVLEGIRANEPINPLGMILASAELLRSGLHLEHEADCVNAAVKNVLAAGWRTPDMSDRSDALTIDGDKMLRLVSDQINLAGEFLKNR